MSRRWTDLALTLGIALATPAAAYVHPNTAPGFPVEQAFHIGDIDSVNLFNGGLTLTLPLGPSYPVNGGFSYGLKLVYNSHPWIFKTVQHVRPSDRELVTRTQAWPTPCSNAGLGWRVSLGRMDPPCQVPDANDALLGPIYQDEMGTDHVFYAILHPGDAEDAPVAGVQDIQYTRDGSYLRLKVLAGGVRKVEFPDGTVRTFDAAGMPTRIEDPFGNWLAIAYIAATPPENPFDQWKLTDGQGRIQWVHFRTDYHAVDHVDLTAFGGATATYRFVYSPALLGRSCPNNDTDLPDSLGATVSTPLLTSLTLPDGSQFVMPASDHITTPPVNGCTSMSGNITGLTLPTLGRMEWTWQLYHFPGGSTGKFHGQSNPGVATRKLINVGGTAPNSGTWTYVHSPATATSSIRESTTAVTDPLGHTTTNYFSTALDQSFTGWSTYEYSLPFTRNVTLNVAPGVDLNLSRRVRSASGALLRSEYVLYERDPIGAVEVPKIYHSNCRQVRGRTVYEDDGGTFSGVLSSNFDGLGHYRRQDTEGFLGGSPARTHFGNFNQAQGTYAVNAAANTGSGYTLWAGSSPWALETMTYAWDAESGATAFTDLCYAPGTTTVTRRRIHRLDGATRSPNDLLTVYDLSAQGNVTSERSYGGDSPGGLATGADLCALTPPTHAQLQIDHTYSFGVRATSKYSGMGFYVLNQSIDSRTGLVASSQDTAGLATGFEYDAMGRRTWSKPATGQGGFVQYQYTPANPVTHQWGNVIVRQRDSGGKAGPILAVDQLVFDGFGRVFQELRNLPDGTSSKRETLYDGAGNKRSVSEVMSGNPSSVTAFQAYDPFGRAATIRPPDGAGHDVTLTYRGVRQVDRTVQVGTAAGSESPSTTTEVYDRHGRLISVAEPSGSGGAAVTTTYGYDVGSRLTQVTTVAGVTQTRQFVYDRAGLLQSETQPEKGVSGNGGTVTYGDYDSRGHARRKTDGPNDLAFVYDGAERLTQVNEFGGRPLKTFSFSPGNGVNDWSLGKLQQASRYNYLTFGSTPLTVQALETYTYGGRDGRVSRRDTAMSTGEAFTQSFTYNALGLPETVTYPVCTHGGCTQPAAAIFSDVPAGHPMRLEIEGLYKAGVTVGCSTTSMIYCPDSPIQRQQMAVFLIAAKEGPGYAPPACVTPTFADVPCSSPFAPWVEELRRRGITGGCNTNPLRFCPEDQVSNAQMAVFLLATREGTGYAVPACTAAPFADAPCGQWYSSWVAELARRQITSGCGGGNFCPNSVVTRGQMAVLLTRTFDLPLQISPTTSRTVQLAYVQGLLTSVSSGSTTYGTISYHPNLLVSQVVHGNGVTETQGNDPSFRRRPSSEGAAGPYAGWSSGAYAYDGAGNITRIGNSTFLYDKVSRLTSGTIYDGPTGGGAQKQQSYTFDAFGNLTSIAGTSGRATPTSAATNRLNGAGVQYDAAGNLTSWNGAVYQYDRFNQISRMTSGGEDRLYLYTADDERIWSYDANRNVSHWTLRDLSGKVLRDYLNDNGRWSLDTDSIYRDGLLLAAETQAGRRHYHLDHLGTPRLITRASGYPASYHVYYPFGEEATAFNQDTERMKFTGHERDLASLAGPGDDLDYMHARFYSPVTGRFLSTDAAPGRAPHPQSWNRYVYAIANPLRFVDPDGQDVWDVVNGFGNALGSDLLLGAGRMEPVNDDYAFGQKGGDFAAGVAAIEEVQDGLIVAGAGALVTVGSSGAASEGSVPVSLIGGIAVLHGIGVFITANSMLGENGVQTTSKTLYNKGGTRVDVENPNPGQRPGQVHVQQGDKKFLFDPDSKTFKDAPKAVQDLLKNPKVRAAIERGMKYLGEHGFKVK